MSSHPDPADRLLDEAVTRLRSLPVPDYPGPPRLDPPRPVQETRTPATGRRNGAGVLTVVCSVLLLAVVAMILPTREKPTRPAGLANVLRHPVQVRTVEPDGEFRSLEQELDAISLRLEAIDNEIETQKLLSDSRSLLAQYTIPESNW